MTRYYPAYLNIDDRLAVVIGGGTIAERKIEQLLASGARVTLVSPEATPEVERLASSDAIRWIKRAYSPGDLAGAWIAIAATDNPEINRAVHQEAEQEKTLLNVVDVTDLCGFIAPSIVERGAVTIAISTGGTSPALARKMRELISGEQNPAHYDHEGFCRCIEWARAAGVLSEVRAELKAEQKTASPDSWQRAMHENFLTLVLANKDEEAKTLLRTELLSDAKE